MDAKVKKEVKVGTKVKGWFRVVDVSKEDAYYSNRSKHIGREVFPIPHPLGFWPSPRATQSGETWISLWCIDRAGNKDCYHTVKLEPLNKRWPLVLAE